MSSTRIYYGRDQWKQWILECRDSGLAISDWCNQRGLNPNRFYKWRKKFLEDGTITGYPLRSEKTLKQSACGSDEKTQFPAVVQVNLESLTKDTLPEPPAYRNGQPFTDSQILVETPVHGYRIHLGTGFDQEVLRKLLEVAM